MVTVVPAHAPADSLFAQELTAFLEAGCNVNCFTRDAAIKPGQDIIAAADEGLSADILILILSQASSPSRWGPRDRWERLLFDRAKEMHTSVAVFLLETCAFPEMLRRQLKFFDATADRLSAMRRLKRWIWSLQLRADPEFHTSPDLEPLYLALADQPGTLTASGAMASRFAAEAVSDFEAVFWIHAHGRTLAQIAGELGSQLQMKLDGPLEDNCRRIRDLVSGTRCLVILDAPEVAVESIMTVGRASFLFSSEPVHILDEQGSLSAARKLISAGRLAEAYELLHRLLKAGVEREHCARELAWICEHWDCHEEASALRSHFRLPPSEQLLLF